MKDSWNKTSKWQRLGLALLFVWVGVGALGLLLSLMPNHEGHAHTSDADVAKLTANPMPEVGVEAALEPITDSVRYVYGFVEPRQAVGHYPFPRYCGHSHVSRPNHTYYFWSHKWTNGNHYHYGDMNHAIGTDYDYRFRCGENGNHQNDAWPDGWFVALLLLSRRVRQSARELLGA